MIPAPVIKGWCPGALRPMLSGDGWVVRVRPRAGRLTQDQAAGIAGLAQAYGNGLIDLSSRANLQIRGVAEAAITPLVQGLEALGLIDPSPEAEARRNIILTPFWEEADGNMEICRALETALETTETPAFPGKFGFTIDLGAENVLSGASGDIRIERGLRGMIVRGDGFLTGAAVDTAEDAAEAALDLARWFLAQGGRGRMADLAIKDREHHLPERFKAEPAFFEWQGAPAIGQKRQGFLAGMAFGPMSAQTLSAIAQLGALRLTPWRMILIERLDFAPEISDIITDADNPLLRVVACTGAPGCPQGLGPTRALAAALAPHVAQGTLLHVSGCAKGCAHPKPADLTLVAAAGGYHLIRDGRASDPVQGTVMTASDLTKTPELLKGSP